jgi:hypothetical protein
MCCSFVITCVRNIFQQSYPIPPKAGIEWCAALCDSRVSIFNSPTQFYLKAGIKVMCCSFVIPCVGIFNSPTQFPPIKQVKVMCCSFVITRVKYFSTVYPIPPIKQGLSDVLLFCDYFVFEYFFQQSYPFPPMKQGLSDVLLFCDSLCLEYFSTVLPNSHL